VVDGSGHGWPLDGTVTVAGTDVETTADPRTGAYKLDLPAGSTYSVKVRSGTSGYTVATHAVEVGERAVERDLPVPVDVPECVADGYAFTGGLARETFGDGTTPEGWTVVDRAGTGQVWAFDSPGGQGNTTGGEGGFATVNSNLFPDGHQDTDLVSPAIDLSDVAEPVLRFAQSYWASSA